MCLYMVYVTGIYTYTHSHPLVYLLLSEMQSPSLFLPHVQCAVYAIFCVRYGLGTYMYIQGEEKVEIEVSGNEAEESEEEEEEDSEIEAAKNSDSDSSSNSESNSDSDSDDSGDGRKASKKKEESKTKASKISKKDFKKALGTKSEEEVSKILSR